MLGGHEQRDGKSLPGLAAFIRNAFRSRADRVDTHIAENALATGGADILVLAEENSEIEVASTLQVVEFRSERQRVWGATVEHRLRAAPGGWKIARKRVDLVNSEGELDGIAILF